MVICVISDPSSIRGFHGKGVSPMGRLFRSTTGMGASVGCSCQPPEDHQETRRLEALVCPEFLILL
jgi:hypothetical protein